MEASASRMARPMPALLILCMALGAAHLACAQENLIANPGFELDEDGDGIPDGWTFSWASTKSTDTPELGRQEPDWGRDADVAHSGDASARIGVERAIDDGLWQQQNIELPADVPVFRLSAWIKVEGADGGAAHVAVVYLGEDNGWLAADYSAILVDQDTDWRRFVALCQPPEGTKFLRLRLWTNFHRRGPITAWYDDVAFEPTDLE